MKIFFSAPPSFISQFVAAGCLCEYKQTFLLVKRNPLKPYGNTWALPGGKLEKNEGPREAVIREVQEETGINLKNDKSLMASCSLFVRHPHFDYVFHVFRKTFDEIPQLQLAHSEHVEAGWWTLDEALSLPLIFGAFEMFTLLFPEYFKKGAVQ